MKKQTAIFFYILGIYVVLQFAWWGYHLIELTGEIKKEASFIQKRVFMIIGEGLVFFIILLLGLWKIRSSIKKDLALTQQQNNFLLSVTHELKTPLSANKLYLQTILKRNPEHSKQISMIEKAIQENERLEIMIDNILNATRLESNALKAIKTSIDFSDFLEKLAIKIRKQHPTEFLNTMIEPGITCSVDSFFIETIVHNLIDNAIKYAGYEGQIKLYLIIREGKTTFGVKDNGPGITMTEQSAMFKKFFRSGNEETRTQKGAGLGLFIVSELVKAHGASIQYINNQPKGANFEVTL